MNELLRTLHHLDKDITLAVNSVHCPASDFIWQAFSNKYIWIVLYLAVIFFLFRNLGWKKAIAVMIAVILTIVCCDQFSNFTKHFFGRLRPCCDLEMMARGLRCLSWHSPIDYGFYSAHAANSMGFAVGSLLGFRIDGSRRYRAYGISVIAWAVLVGLSRIFVGMHFAGDVAVGLILGALIAWAWIAIARLIIKKLGI